VVDLLGQQLPVGPVPSAGTGSIAAVDPFQDAGQLPVPERHEALELADRRSEVTLVGVDHLSPGPEALGKRGRGSKGGAARVARLGPVHEQQPEVGTGIPEGAELPVEDRPELAIVADHRVVEAVVAVDDRERSVERDGRREAVVHCPKQRAIPLGGGKGRLGLAHPTSQLTGDVAASRAEVAEAHGRGVDVVELDEPVDHRGRCPGASRDREQGLGLAGIGEHVAVDEVHDEERGSRHARVFAEAEDGRDRHLGPGERSEHPSLSDHVVGSCEHVTRRRPSHDHPSTHAIGGDEGQVGTASGDECVRQRPNQTVDMVEEPCGDAGFVESFHGSSSLPTPSRGRASPVPAATVWGMAIVDVQDATFEAAVLDRSEQVPVVVDLWAPWCGPCKALSPILERLVAEREGAVDLAKVNVDENPRVAASFQVQSIPSVFAVVGRTVVDGFVGALGEREVQAFLERIAPSETEADRLVAQGDEASLRKALELDPAHRGAIEGLASLLLDRGEPAEALELLARIPETPETRRLAARARLAEEGGLDQVGDINARLESLLERVKTDDGARQEFLDLLETLPDEAEAAAWRRRLTSALFA